MLFTFYECGCDNGVNDVERNANDTLIELLSHMFHLCLFLFFLILFCDRSCLVGFHLYDVCLVLADLAAQWCSL